MAKLPRRYSGIVMGAILSLTMSLLMSFTITLINLGLAQDFLHKWMVAFAGALPVSFPVSLIVTPVIKVCVDRISD